MNVARVNFSHGSHEDHRRVMGHVRSLADSFGSPIGILADLCGPKIRLGRVVDEPLELVEGDRVVLTSDDVDGSRERLSIGYEYLSRDVRRGDPIVMNDGAVTARVDDMRGADVHCTIEHGGEVGSHKGANFPATPLRVPSLTDKDRLDLEVALDAGADFVALSFVREADDIKTLRGLIEQHGHPAKIIAKIEKREALDNFDEILLESDGIMVARGDLGIETELAEVPFVQKDLISRARAMSRPVITATQMLESMVTNAIPTRAEVADVANAILDGTDAVMLSAETAIGRNPVATVDTMACIIRAAESSSVDRPVFQRGVDRRRFSVSEAIGHGTAQLCTDLDISAAVVYTTAGMTARTVARFRPMAPIIAGTHDPLVARQLTASWGVVSVALPELSSLDHMVREVSAAAVGTGVVCAGDQVVIAAGIPFGGTPHTNLLLVQSLS